MSYESYQKYLASVLTRPVRLVMPVWLKQEALTAWWQQGDFLEK